MFKFTTQNWGLFKILWNSYIPAIRPRRYLIGILPIFEFQNLKQIGHSDFQEEQKTIWNWVVKDWSCSSKSHCLVQYV